ncbi:large ribosomal subunit protein P1-like [Dysidea avara]|uniref:large ribosomal subunit protein P1-like n=1 Tax=Dysidea avara TaxID=196820 RepID=UPI00333365A5
MSTSELACVYSALILYDDGIEVTADRITTLIKTANVNVEPVWPSLFARALKGKDIGALISNVGSGVAVASSGGGGATATGGEEAAKEEEKKEEKKEESEEESDDDMGFGLFD